MSVLQIDDLTIDLPPGADRAHAVHGISLTLDPNEILCVVGESGSGKSMTAQAIMGLLPPLVRPSAGRIMFEGRNLLTEGPAALRALRGGRISMIFQEPMTALNPLMRIGDQIGNAMRYHGIPGRQIGPPPLELLGSAGL